jgi:hypothetical protein
MYTIVNFTSTMPPNPFTSMLKDPDRYVGHADVSKVLAENDNSSDDGSEKPDLGNIETEAEPESEFLEFDLKTRKGLRKAASFVEQEANYLAEQIAEYGEDNLSPEVKDEYEDLKLLFASTQQLIEDARRELQNPTEEAAAIDEAVNNSLSDLIRKINEFVDYANGDGDSLTPPEDLELAPIDVAETNGSLGTGEVNQISPIEEATVEVENEDLLLASKAENKENPFDFSTTAGLAEVTDFIDDQQAQLDEYIDEFGFLNLNESNREQYQNILALAAGIRALIADSSWKLSEARGRGFLDTTKYEDLLEKLLRESDTLLKSIETQNQQSNSVKNIDTTYEENATNLESDTVALEQNSDGEVENGALKSAAVAAGAAAALAAAEQNLSRAEEMPNLPKELTPYERLRLQWLEAKDYHERAHALYQAKVTEYYEGIIQTEGRGQRLWERLRATANFKRSLPPEFEEERVKVEQITARYNELGRKMLEVRQYAGKEAVISSVENRLVTTEQQKKQAVYERYQRMLARTTITNTFDEEMKSQEEAMEALKIKPPKLLQKHPQLTRVLGAAVIGGLAGSVTVGANAFLRMVVGGTLSAAAAGFINKRYEGRIEDINDEFEDAVREIGKQLAAGGMTAEELHETYQYLASIYSRVDSEKRKRLRDIIAASLALGAASGASIAEFSDLGALPDVDEKISETYNGGENTDQPFPATTEDLHTPQAVDSYGGVNSDTPAPLNQMSETAAQPPSSAEATVTAKVAELTKAGESLPATYEAKAGDNYWNIMEGETAAGKIPVIEQVAAEHRQALIDLARDALDKNETLRAEIGFGDKMDNLGEGDNVNVQKLHAAAVEIAEKEGWLSESATVDTSDVGGESGASEATAGSSEISNDNEAAGPATEANQTKEVVSTPEPKAMVTPDVAPAAVAPEAGATREVVHTEAASSGEVSAGDGSPQAEEVANDNFDGSPSTTYEYVLKHFDSPAEFEKSFREEWINQIQSTGAVKNAGFMGFGGEPYMDAFHHFEAMNIAEFNKLAVLSPAELNEYLDLHDLNPADYEAWNKSIAEWRRDPDIHFTVEDRFEEVAKAAYIERVLEAKRVAA